MLVLWSWMWGCQAPPAESFDDPCAWDEIDCTAGDWPPNVLLVIMDDVGTDLVGLYGVGDNPAPTPTIDALAADGLVMERAYAYPWCSPTRAALMTGQRPSTWGIGRAIRVQDDDEVSLPLRARVLPERLDRDSPYAWSHALIGKWHLTQMRNDAFDAPLRHGWQRFRGHIANLYGRHAYDGATQGYYDYEHVIDGTITRETRYATSQTVDDALTTMSELEAPWLMWVAVHAAHEPFEPPPPELHSYGPLTMADPVAVRYRAITEALDTELGRMLADMPADQRENTVVMVMGDNGTSGQAFTGPLDGLPNKSSIFELGIRVPLIVHWPGMVKPGRRYGGMVQAEDVHATMLHLAGLPRNESQGQSFLRLLVDPSATSEREVVLSEVFEPNGVADPNVWARAAVGSRFKLVEHHVFGRQLYDLEGRDYEGEPLPLDALDSEAQAALDTLSAELETLTR